MTFETFFNDYGVYVFVLLGYIVNLILSVKTGNKKYIKEMYENMIKYRTANYQDNLGDSKFSGQSFEDARFKPIYRLNKSTGLLEKTDDVIDVQEMLDSCKNMALESVMAKFLPSIETVNDTTELNNLTDALDSMLYATSLKEQYRKKYNIGDDVTDDKLEQYMFQKAKELELKLSNKDIKGDIENEKDDIEKTL